MMTDKAKRKFCKDIVNKWRSRLFLGEWFIDLCYASTDKDEQPGGRPAAECRADPVYMQATITIYPCFWNSDVDRRIHMLVHELCHCHTQSVWNIIKNFSNGFYTVPDDVHAEIEILTQRMANIAYQQEWK